ncbi:hypothetical protein CLV47_105133 [Antricoccus suffuscus]|uniref:Uncharacterized protein n=1 Tax=Antricoccus suffuscus TaxID=1629062 RepID=A0A2T1A1M8_9ACTN|nr:hypothetical protein [Antricoccus suffuscus]PRZ42511.1 hypothetical protein CLV47_105133 [Antricoccus suffuscus]
MLLVPLISLAVLVIAAIASRITRSPIAAVFLALASGIWLVANNRLEGPVLITFTPRNGLTATDLLGLVGFFYALYIVWERYVDSTRLRVRRWALIGLCAAVFLVLPVTKLFISLLYPCLFEQIRLSWVGVLIG